MEFLEIPLLQRTFSERHLRGFRYLCGEFFRSLRGELSPRPQFGLLDPLPFLGSVFLEETGCSSSVRSISKSCSESSI